MITIEAVPTAVFGAVLAPSSASAWGWPCSAAWYPRG